MVSPQLEGRVPVDLDICVWGMAADGHAFSQHARTQNISASGALLCKIEHELKIGDTIGVKIGQTKTRCKVVWTRNSRSILKIQVGVQLLSKRECPWVAFLPKTNSQEPTATPGVGDGPDTRLHSPLLCITSVPLSASQRQISAAAVVTSRCFRLFLLEPV